MSTPTLHDTEYQAAAERVLAAIERQCDDWLQQGVIDVDTHRDGSTVAGGANRSFSCLS